MREKIKDPCAKKKIIYEAVCREERTYIIQWCAKFDYYESSRFHCESIKGPVKKIQFTRGWGKGKELLSRLDAAYPDNTWMAMARGDGDVVEEGQHVADVNGVIGPDGAAILVPGFPGTAENLPSGSELARELVLARREIELMKREMALVQREAEVDRASSRSSGTGDRPGINIKTISDLLGEFNGAEESFLVWERQITLLRNYGLDDNSTKMLMSMKIKGKALVWLHSCAEHLEMNAADLLFKMKQMYDHRPSKLQLKRRFEERKWRVSETFIEYQHEKVTMANKISIAEEDLVEYLIDGIPEQHLQNQARMQRFETVSSLCEAFSQILLPSEGRRSADVSTSLKKKDKIDQKGAAGRTVRCFNCNEEGHVATACKKPRREKGSCYHCGDKDHQFRWCPKKKKEQKKIERAKSKVQQWTEEC